MVNGAPGSKQLIGKTLDFDHNVFVIESANHEVSAFATYQPPLGYGNRDLTISVGDDLAFGYSLNRVSGTLKNGNKSDVWIRWTACFRNIDGKWLIVNHHVSVPFDPTSGKAVLTLEA